MREAHLWCAMRMRYERSEPRIARRKRNKNSRNCFAVRLFFMERSGSPYFKLKINLSQCENLELKNK
jgi:hypothetical protein